MRLIKDYMFLAVCCATLTLAASALCYAEDGSKTHEYTMADPYIDGEMIPNGPSIAGPTGLVKNPSAYVLAPWDYDVSVDVVGWKDYVKANVGLPRRFEAGVTFVEKVQQEGSLNLKWNFVPEAQEHPAVSAGLLDLASTNRTKYAVVSKNFTSGKKLRSKHRIDKIALRYQVGYRTSDIDDSLFYGLEARFLISKKSPFMKALKKTTFMEEYDGDHFNFGMRYDLSESAKLHFGILSVEDISVGISYRKNL